MGSIGNAELSFGGGTDTTNEMTKSSAGGDTPIEGQEPSGEIGTDQPPESDEHGAQSRPPEWAAFESELRELRNLMDERLRRDETKEEAFRRLYSDLETFKQWATAYQFRPLYLDIILLMDRLDILIGSHRAEDPCCAALTSVHAELSEILARRGVNESMSVSNLFDPKLQHAVDVAQTEDSEQHHTVAQVLRPGYETEGGILRPADVVVRKYIPQDSEPSADGDAM